MAIGGCEKRWIPGGTDVAAADDALRGRVADRAANRDKVAAQDASVQASLKSKYEIYAAAQKLSLGGVVAHATCLRIRC